ncbi:DELTA-sagatoxin-Srs1a-like [Enoplosus armatus]|uniref:DELTA-sagatoxin-Srs1a-like n=1 Tax=Enoplosus armatus TaxID=215367 RepID=UPI003991281A
MAFIPVVGAAAAMLPTHRQCTIEITNECRDYTLCNPSVYTSSGSSDTPLPPTINSFATGSALFIEAPYSACGCVAVFTYDLLKKDTRRHSEKMAVMFSVPYDFNLYSNWYAVGVFDKSEACDYDLYCKMYYECDKTFVRGKANGPSLTCKGGPVTIRATMSDSYQPTIKVQVSKN